MPGVMNGCVNGSRTPKLSAKFGLYSLRMTFLRRRMVRPCFLITSRLFASMPSGVEGMMLEPDEQHEQAVKQAAGTALQCLGPQMLDRVGPKKRRALRNLGHMPLADCLPGPREIVAERNRESMLGAVPHGFRQVASRQLAQERFPQGRAVGGEVYRSRPPQDSIQHIVAEQRHANFQRVSHAGAVGLCQAVLRE